MSCFRSLADGHGEGHLTTFLSHRLPSRTLPRPWRRRWKHFAQPLQVLSACPGESGLAVKPMVQLSPRFNRLGKMTSDSSTLRRARTMDLLEGLGSGELMAAGIFTQTGSGNGSAAVAAAPQSPAFAADASSPGGGGGKGGGRNPALLSITRQRSNSLPGSPTDGAPSRHLR